MKYNLERFQGNRRVVEVADGATKGATVGVDLFYNGVLVLWEDIYNGGGGTTPTTPGTTITAWSLILDIPANVTALANTATTGLYAITGPGTSATREIQPTVGRTTVSNGDGVAGDPVIDLAVVVDSGVGAALMKRTIDGFGRVSGSQTATTDDLAEGATNLYFPEAPIDGTPYARQDAAWVAAGGGGSNTRGITVTGGSIGGAVITVAQVIGGLSASDYTLTGNWYLWCSPSGSIEVDVRRAAFGSLPPGPGDTICGGNEPAVSGAISASGNFTGWSTGIARNDALSVVVNSVTDVTWFVLLLEAV